MVDNTLQELDSEVILVNSKNQNIGAMNKLLAHQKGMLHRAYSIFIFRMKNEQIELLLQRRSTTKYHGGGLWTNTCCSHPKHDNSLIDDAVNRLYVELGIKIPLVEVGRFRYFATLGNNMFEHEIDHVLIGFWIEQVISPNPQEVSAYCWKEIHELKNNLRNEAKAYTPWLSQALKLALRSDYFAQFAK